MEKTSYLKENCVRFMKENSPPCNTKDADVCDNEHHTVGENCFKVLEKHGMPQQPLQVSNNQIPSNKQNLQPELLKKFRQLRQWQQQQQDTMFKKQQQQMDNIKMQQDKLEALFKKTTSTPPAVQSIPQVSDTQVSHEETSYINNDQPTQESPRDILLKTSISRNNNEPMYSLNSYTNVFSPMRNQGYSYQQGNSPILMTPMHFIKSTSTSPVDDVPKSIPVYTVAQSSRQLLTDNLPSNNHGQDFRDVITSDNESDYHSDTDTMSGVYPLQDDNISEACGTEIEQDDHDTNINEEDLDNTVCEQHMDNKQEMKDEEERPINPGIGSSKAATFEELLERELKSGQPNVQETLALPPNLSQNPYKPKQTFLKKGQGLARFGMKPQQAKKPKISKKIISPRNKNSPSRLLVEKKEEKVFQTQPAIPQIKIQRKIASRSSQEFSPTASSSTAPSQSFGSSVLASRVIGPFKSTNSNTGVTKTTLTTTNMLGGALKPTNPLLSPLSSLDFSFHSDQKEFDETKDDEDLEEFEMLEQAAANASFSSNSSLVTKVLERARSKSKPDNIPISRASSMEIPNILSPVDTGYGSCEGRGPESIVVSQPSSGNENRTESDSSENDDSDNDTTLKEDLEQHRLPQQSIDNKPTHTVMSSQGDFDDEEAWGEIKAQTEETESDTDSDDSDVTISEPFAASVLQGASQQRQHSPQAFTGPSSHNVMSTPPASALMSKLFPKLKGKPKVQEETKSNKEQQQQPVTTDIVGPSREVQEKLKELEDEINKFRAENTALAKIRQERDEGLKRLQNEIDLFEKQKIEELERIEKFKKEEMLKLKRERKVFEKYQKAAKSIPDKKERDEIEALKTQVSELQEELKRRESRWSAASSRYRNRIEALEEQNKELQEEVKLLEKYRLEQWRENQTKAKDNEEAKPRETILRKTAKPLTPVLPPEASINPLLEESTPSEQPLHQLPPSISPPRKDGRSVTQDTNNNKIISSNLTRQVEPKPPSPITKSRRSKQNTPNNEPTKQAIRENNSFTQEKIKHGLQEIEHPDGKVEQVQPDGSRVILFANGTKKEISQDGQTVIVTFFNGDIKQVFPDQRVVYHYSEAQTTHTTYPDGLEVLQFPNKQIEKHYVDGTKEIIFPDQTIKYLYVDGTEECVYADGTIQRTRSTDGEKIIEFPNGQREVHTKHFKRREYPDGTVKTVYPDGRTETRYSTGRLRVKDREGRVVMDTEVLQQE